MYRMLNLCTVTSAVRARICAECPNRSRGGELRGNDFRTDAPRACEAVCPLFQSLPKLRGLASGIDPMVGRFEPAMRRAIREVERSARGPRAGLSRRGREFAGTLRNLSGN